MQILVARSSWISKRVPQDPHLSLWTDLSASVQGSPRVALNFGSRTHLNFYVVTRPGKNTILLLKSSQDFGGASTSVAPPPTRAPPFPCVPPLCTAWLPELRLGSFGLGGLSAPSSLRVLAWLLLLLVSSSSAASPSPLPHHSVHSLLTLPGARHPNLPPGHEPPGVLGHEGTQSRRVEDFHLHWDPHARPHALAPGPPHPAHPSRPRRTPGPPDRLWPGPRSAIGGSLPEARAAP